MTPPEDVGMARAMFVDRGGDGCPARNGALDRPPRHGPGRDPCPTSTKLNKRVLHAFGMAQVDGTDPNQSSGLLCP